MSDKHRITQDINLTTKEGGDDTIVLKLSQTAAAIVHYACRSSASNRGCVNKSLLVVARVDGAITGVDCAVCGTPWKTKPLAECQPDE